MAVKLAFYPVQQRLLIGKADSLHLYDIALQIWWRCMNAFTLNRTVQPDKRSSWWNADQQAAIGNLGQEFFCIIHRIIVARVL